MRLPFLLALCVLLLGADAPFDPGVAQRLASVHAIPHVIPQPAFWSYNAICPAISLRTGLTVAADLDPGARELLDERWRALGIAPTRIVRSGETPLVRVTISSRVAAQGYELSTSDGATVRIIAGDPDGAFYAFTTLAQLAHKTDKGYVLPCMRIADAPALRWRILSDDISRGPLPTMRYFKERIRTIAAFKMNGYSPYMEHVFIDPRHPLPAPLDGITPGDLRALDAYARRFHVAFIPEQQTFAHMHNTLRWEQYAALAELPHGYLLSPANPQSALYVQDLIADELEAVPHPPFFHIGSDEPFDLGRGQSKELVAQTSEDAVYTRHVVDTANFVIEKSTARPMIWDDALARHPDLFTQLPKSLVFVNWHYGAEKTFVPYIQRIAKGGFDQMVAPGGDNWNEIYPDIATALPNINTFVTEGKAAHVLGLFATVWHDDGETLFEETWYPLLYAAASAWQGAPVDQARFSADFPFAFFGVDDPGYASDLTALAQARTLLHESGDPLFWSDAFDQQTSARITGAVDLAALRRLVESAIVHLRTASAPPLHANAASVMQFAARRYDALARNFQIATEARGYYADAVANTGGKHDDIVFRDLFVTKYLFWEQRDTMLELEPLAQAAWEYEDRSSHELSVLERYHIAADRAI
ncbi:MAG TPA: glycoside hydrolase family 20 zincin-like fold domain-containing protein, partial [Candidatus Baltobacteraceae bacterium]